jgi:inorganic pyrophosphatase/exopolyphosphatase
VPRARSLKGRQVSDLSDDEILMLALTAAQAALMKHVEPGHRDAEETLNTILSVLDHHTIAQVELRKLHSLRGLPSNNGTRLKD